MQATTDRRVDPNDPCLVPGCNQIHIPNVPLFRKIRSQIVEDPESWAQEYYVVNPDRFGSKLPALRKREYIKGDNDNLIRTGVTVPVCKTAYCIAGWAAQLSDDPLKTWVRDFDGRTFKTEETVSGLYVSERAAHELGLLPSEAQMLFAGGNSFATVDRLMRQFAALVGDEL